jgi:hypothetical protein
VRSSWEASATNWRIRSSLASRTANEDSMRASIVLRLRDSEVTSSSAWRTGMRCVRSPAAMAAAVSSMRVSGRKARRTAYRAIASEASRTSVLMSPVVMTSWVTVSLTVSRGTPTAKVESSPTTRPAMKRHCGRPPSDGTVNGSPLVTRGSSTVRTGRTGRAVSPVGSRVIAPRAPWRWNAYPVGSADPVLRRSSNTWLATGRATERSSESTRSSRSERMR